MNLEKHRSDLLKLYNSRKSKASKLKVYKQLMELENEINNSRTN